jgi:hypothetical protein
MVMDVTEAERALYYLRYCFRLAFARLELAPPISSDPACRRRGLPLSGKSGRPRQSRARALLGPRLQLTMSLLS